MDNYTDWLDAEADQALFLTIALVVFVLCAIGGLVAIVWVQP